MTIELSCLKNTILNKEKGERISLEPRGAGCVCSSKRRIKISILPRRYCCDFLDLEI